MTQSPPSLSTLPPIASHKKWKWLEGTHWGRTFVSWRLYVRNPVPLPSFIPKDGPKKVRDLLHLIYAAELKNLGNPGRAARTLMITGWVATTAATCFINFRRQRSMIRREFPDMGDLQHLKKLLACAFLHNIAPGEFYVFKLYLDQFYLQRQYYLVRWQVTTLLNEALPASDSIHFNDKYQFWRRLSAADIPTVPVLSMVENERWTRDDWDKLTAAKQDLVAKPTLLSRGEGIEFFDTKGENRWQFENRTLTGEEVRERITLLSREHPFLIQPRMENHPMLARYGMKGLATIRLVTMKTRAMLEPLCLVAFLRIPSGENRVSNFHQRSSECLACQIDLETGQLGEALDWGPTDNSFTAHPTNGAPIAGETLPQWEECKAYCLRAHQLAPDLNSIGWDVIITPDGPLVLEANLLWGARALQLITRTPSLLSSFVDYYEESAESIPGNPR